MTRIPTLLRMLYIVLRADGHFGPDFCFSGLEGDLEPELVVDGCLLGGGGVADDIAQVAEGGDEGADVVLTRPPEIRATSVMILYPCCGPEASAVRIRNVGSCMACLVILMLYTDDQWLGKSPLRSRPEAWSAGVMATAGTSSARPVMAAPAAERRGQPGVPRAVGVKADRSACQVQHRRPCRRTGIGARSRSRHVRGSWPTRPLSPRRAAPAGAGATSSQPASSARRRQPRQSLGSRLDPKLTTPTGSESAAARPAAPEDRDSGAGRGQPFASCRASYECRASDCTSPTREGGSLVERAP